MLYSFFNSFSLISGNLSCQAHAEACRQDGQAPAHHSRPLLLATRPLLAQDGPQPVPGTRQVGPLRPESHGPNQVPSRLCRGSTAAGIRHGGRHRLGNRSQQGSLSILTDQRSRSTTNVGRIQHEQWSQRLPLLWSYFIPTSKSGIVFQAICDHSTDFSSSKSENVLRNQVRTFSL